jgi:hypothetical protein
MKPAPTISALMLAVALLLPGTGRAVTTASGISLRASTMSIDGAGQTGGETLRNRQAGSAIRAPRRAPTGPNRLGDRECCKTPECRCGCLYSLVGAAVAALRSH